MIQLPDDPRKLGIPHDTYRSSQKNAILSCLQLYNDGGGVAVIEAPVGVGKSAIPTGLGYYEDVTVLVHSHALLRQYEQLYGFDIIMGKPEYPCILDDKVDDWKKYYNMVPTAADCHFQDMEKHCPLGHDCPYIVARNTAMTSRRAACTYKYAAVSERIRNRSGVVVFDEAHDCYEELINHAQFQMTEELAGKYRFQSLPLPMFGTNGEGDILEGANRKKVQDWVVDCISKIGVKNLFNEITPDGAKHKKLLEQMMVVSKMLDSGMPLYYRCNRPGEFNDWRFFERTNTGMTMQIRSLDVRYLIEEIMHSKTLAVYMSATIGDPKPLMSELGILNFTHRSYPHPTPKEKRPVYDLGVEKMTKANLDAHPGLYKIQADKISAFIKSLDPSWRGIVLTTSNYKIKMLRRFLGEKLNGRVLVPDQGVPMSAQFREFITDMAPGKVLVGTIQGLGSGVSLDGDKGRFSVVAGVPYANPGDRFDQLRTSTESGRRYAFWRAYCAVIQATGRVTRSEIEDDGTYMLNVGAIADGSALTPQARGSYSKWFSEAIVRWT